MPAAVGERAEQLGIETTRSFGSTEHPSITGCYRRVAAREARAHRRRDRCPASRSASSTTTATTSSSGEPGEIWSRGPDCFVGYTDPRVDRGRVRADGWFMTGDVGVLDADGYLAITDRKKDIIIRGGENVSAAEVEEMLVRMPGVAEVAVVAAPDARLGEVGCAFFRMQPGTTAPDLAAVRDAPRAARASRGRSGPSTSARSTSSRARRAARCRSSCCASGCARKHRRRERHRSPAMPRAAGRRARARRQPVRRRARSARSCSRRWAPR